MFVARCISLHCLPTKGMEFPKTRIAFMQSLNILLSLLCASGCFQNLTMPCVALQERQTFGALLVQVSKLSLSEAAVCPSRAS